MSRRPSVKSAFHSPNSVFIARRLKRLVSHRDKKATQLLGLQAQQTEVKNEIDELQRKVAGTHSWSSLLRGAYMTRSATREPRAVRQVEGDCRRAS